MYAVNFPHISLNIPGLKKKFLCSHNYNPRQQTPLFHILLNQEQLRSVNGKEHT